MFNLPKSLFHSGYWVCFLPEISRNFRRDFNVFPKHKSYEVLPCIHLQNGKVGPSQNGYKTESDALLTKLLRRSTQCRDNYFHSCYQGTSFANIIQPRLLVFNFEFSWEGMYFKITKLKEARSNCPLYLLMVFINDQMQCKERLRK